MDVISRYISDGLDVLPRYIVLNADTQPIMLNYLARNNTYEVFIRGLKLATTLAAITDATIIATIRIPPEILSSPPSLSPPLALEITEVQPETWELS